MNRSFRYAAYGAINASSGGSTPTLLGHASQLYDATGLYYVRARWYDPASARFLTRDPLRLGAPAATQYGYAGGNPLAMADPSGLLATADAGGIACDQSNVQRCHGQLESGGHDHVFE